MTPWTSAHQASLSITNCRSPPKPMSIESVMPSHRLILCRPLLPPDGKSWLIWKDPDAGKDWGQEKGTTEDEVVGWHHRLNRHGFGWTPAVGDGQGGLACCGSWNRKELDTAEWLNWTEVVNLVFWVRIPIPLFPWISFITSLNFYVINSKMDTVTLLFSKFCSFVNMCGGGMMRMNWENAWKPLALVEYLLPVK